MARPSRDTPAGDDAGRSRPAVLWSLLAVAAVLVGAGAVFLIKGTSTTTPPKVDANGTQASRVPGFNQIGFRVRTPRGTLGRHCALLALTTAQQDQGLMNRTDLAGYDGMVFQFLGPTTVQFYMKDTLISLSIAWFDQSGRFVSAADMAPCGSAATCPLYHADAPYSYALEVPEGRLGPLGIGVGSHLVVGGGC